MKLLRNKNNKKYVNNIKKYKYTFTVFTPTYNRAHVLHRVYYSLGSQTFRNFEWIIVDDGSKDNTRELVNEWAKESDFPIRYYFQENKGKHIAFNRAVRLAEGELFLTLDSDDACIPLALEKFKYYWDSIPENEKQHFSAVTALCKDENNILAGTRFPSDIFDSNPLEMRFKYKVKGEKWGFQKTDIIKEYPFPEVENASFVSEDVVWNSIARKYKTRFINEVLRIYYNNDCNTNQLTKTKPMKAALSYIPLLTGVLNYDIRWIVYDPLIFYKYSANFIRYSLHSRESMLKRIKVIKPVISKLLLFIAMPIGVLLFIRDKHAITW